MLGNLPFFMEAEELTNYDIVSYGFDDLEGLYLRGQWTVHRNDPPGINQVSRHCSHLTTLLTCHTTCHTTKVVLTTLLTTLLTVPGVAPVLAPRLGSTEGASLQGSVIVSK